MDGLKLYEIDEALAACFDPETGEVLDDGAFDALAEAREKKIEGVGLMVKSKAALVAELKEEKKRITDRIAVLENQNRGTREFLARYLGGKKFETARVRYSYRKATAVQIEDATKIPEKYIRTKITKEPDKVAIKDALKAGEEVPGAELREGANLIIK